MVGRAWDLVDLRGAAPIVQTLGMHTNDKTISFYARTPAGFAVEYGTGGILIDDRTWTPTRYPGAHYWGHQRNRTPKPAAATGEHVSCWSQRTLTSPIAQASSHRPPSTRPDSNTPAEDRT